MTHCCGVRVPWIFHYETLSYPPFPIDMAVTILNRIQHVNASVDYYFRFQSRTITRIIKKLRAKDECCTYKAFFGRMPQREVTRPKHMSALCRTIEKKPPYSVAEIWFSNSCSLCLPFCCEALIFTLISDVSFNQVVIHLIESLNQLSFSFYDLQGFFSLPFSFPK